MFYYDLHCHTKDSQDSFSKIEDIVVVAKKRGLHGIAITDHDNTYNGPLEIDGIKIIPGCEITLKDNTHLLAFFVDGNFSLEMSLEEAIDEIHKRKGVAVLAHPFRGSHGWMKNRQEKDEEVCRCLKKIDGIEIGNSSDFEDERNKAKFLAENFNLVGTAGSDAHTLGQVGFSVIETKQELTRENFQEALRSSKIFVRPEGAPFRDEVGKLKKRFSFFLKHPFLRKNKTIKKIFWDFFVRFYLVVKDRKLRGFDFNYQK